MFHSITTQSQSYYNCPHPRLSEDMVPVNSSLALPTKLVRSDTQRDNQVIVRQLWRINSEVL